MPTSARLLRPHRSIGPALSNDLGSMISFNITESVVLRIPLVSQHLFIDNPQIKCNFLSALPVRSRILTTNHRRLHRLTSTARVPLKCARAVTLFR